MTKREGRSGRITARGLNSTDQSRAPRGPYKKRPSADILPVRSRASLVNKVTRLKKVTRQKVTRLKVTRQKVTRLKVTRQKVTRQKVTRRKVTRQTVTRLKVTRLKKAKTAKTQVRNHSGHCPVQYLEYIGPATEHFDWLILVTGPLTA